MLVVVCILLSVLATSECHKQPHIVLILADDLGWNDVGFHGSSEIPTPNIDALAYSGVILNKHYVLPTCTPSRSALLTGKHPITIGMQGFPMKAGETRGVPLNVKLLPQYLKDLNYATHMIGKWHIGFETEAHLPHNRGFDTFFGYYNGYIEYFKYGIYEPKRVLGSKEAYYGYDLHHNKVDDCFVEYQGEYATRVFTDRAVDIIRDHDPNKPLFLLFSHLAVHAGSLEGSGLEVPKDMDVNKTFPHLAQYERRQFAGVLTELDRSVGRVVKTLEDANLLQDSIIVFLSDNGAQPVSILMQPNWGSNYPLRGGKFTLYEGGVRGTGFVWSPRLPQGVVSDELMHMTDWVPTLYTAAGGLPSVLSGEVDGTDMWASLFHPEGKQHTKRSLLLNIDEMEGMKAAILDGRWKIVKGGIRDYAAYDGHLGQSLINGSLPRYDFEGVRRSTVGSIVLASKGFQTSLERSKMDKIRRRLTVNCGCQASRTAPQFGYRNSSHEYHCRTFCVFDLHKDPCECGSGLQDANEIKIRGVGLLREYQKRLVPQTNTAVDPAANPAHFFGVWKPWKKLATTKNTATRSTLSAVLIAGHALYFGFLK